MNNYRKKPVVIQAVKWTGKMNEEMSYFLDTNFTLDKDTLYINTLEGKMRADKGDYIIRGIKNEFYPCRADIFEATYEPC